MSCAKKTPKKGQDEEDSAKLKQTAHNCTHFDQEEKIVTNESAQELALKLQLQLQLHLQFYSLQLQLPAEKEEDRPFFASLTNFKRKK